jgi:hypothetical protein
MRVLVGYERSGVVRRAFEALGHDAWSCDLQPAPDGSPRHEQCDVRELVDAGCWDLIIVHPPCTFLSVSGQHWNGRRPGRGRRSAAALDEVRWLLDTPARYRARHHVPVRLALENPVGIISTHIRPADQYVQPYQFGDDASKRTGFWLDGLPPLVVPHEEQWIAPRLVCPSCGAVRYPPDYRIPDAPGVACGHTRNTMRKRWANQTDSGQNRLGPSPDRADRRAETYPGLARAMAAQWGADCAIFEPKEAR